MSGHDESVLLLHSMHQHAPFPCTLSVPPPCQTCNHCHTKGTERDKFILIHTTGMDRQATPQSNDLADFAAALTDGLVELEPQNVAERLGGLLVRAADNTVSGTNPALCIAAACGAIHAFLRSCLGGRQAEAAGWLTEPEEFLDALEVALEWEWDAQDLRYVLVELLPPLKLLLELRPPRVLARLVSLLEATAAAQERVAQFVDGMQDTQEAGELQDVATALDSLAMTLLEMLEMGDEEAGGEAAPEAAGGAAAETAGGAAAEAAP